MLLRKGGDDGQAVSRVKMSVHEVWQFLEDAREANVSMRKLAIIRRRDRQGGVRQGSVDLWICKLLSMYHEEARLCFLGSKQLCMVTDASHHSSKDWLISLAYDPLSMNGAYMTAQFVRSAKVIRIGEFELTAEAERVAARRDQAHSGFFKVSPANFRNSLAWCLQTSHRCRNCKKCFPC